MIFLWSQKIATRAIVIMAYLIALVQVASPIIRALKIKNLCRAETKQYNKPAPNAQTENQTRAALACEFVYKTKVAAAISLTTATFYCVLLKIAIIRLVYLGFCYFC